MERRVLEMMLLTADPVVMIVAMILNYARNALKDITKRMDSVINACLGVSNALLKITVHNVTMASWKCKDIVSNATNLACSARQMIHPSVLLAGKDQTLPMVNAQRIVNKDVSNAMTTIQQFVLVVLKDIPLKEITNVSNVLEVVPAIVIPKMLTIVLDVLVVFN